MDIVNSDIKMYCRLLHLYDIDSDITIKYYEGKENNSPSRELNLLGLIKSQRMGEMKINLITNIINTKWFPLYVDEYPKLKQQLIHFIFDYCGNQCKFGDDVCNILLEYVL